MGLLENFCTDKQRAFYNSSSLGQVTRIVVLVSGGVRISIKASPVEKSMFFKPCNLVLTKESES